HSEISLKRAITHWVRCAEWQCRNMQLLHNCVRFTYEEFCRTPNMVREKLVELLPELSDLSRRYNQLSGRTVKGTTRGLSDMNNEQLTRLTSAQRKLITRMLRHHGELLVYWGYRL